jgi:hypothetical protein
MENLFIVTSVVAATEVLRRAKVSDWFAVATIVVAGVIGAAAGALHAPGVADVWTGIIAGLGASGLVTVASRIGGGNSVNNTVNKS